MSDEIRRRREEDPDPRCPRKTENAFAAILFGLSSISPSARETDSSNPYAADVIRQAEYDAPLEWRNSSLQRDQKRKAGIVSKTKWLQREVAGEVEAMGAIPYSRHGFRPVIIQHAGSTCAFR